ncbi:hypothetical protein N7461_001205 [Penicillium sp. DV-2018c]|nr:hypothetical protein N7461_001205 [Penicillium sp. DV-2018c]
MPNPAGRQDMCIVNPGIGAFGDDIGWRQRGAQSSREDVPMPDYASTNSTSSRVLSSMTGLSYEHSKQPSVASGLGDDHYELIENPTPTKAPLGTRAPLIDSIRPGLVPSLRRSSYSIQGNCEPSTGA